MADDICVAHVRHVFYLVKDNSYDGVETVYVSLKEDDPIAQRFRNAEYLDDLKDLIQFTVTNEIYRIEVTEVKTRKGILTWKENK
jgi:hypothetical protein